MRLIVAFSALALAFTCKTAIMLENTELCVKNISFGERGRALLAMELWNRADKLMHKGSIGIKQQKFKAGSYIGNTDIIPLLKMVIYLRPEELIPYKMLSQSYIYSENNISKAMQILIEGIFANQKNNELYELYIEIAKLKIFYSDKKLVNNRVSAIKYLEKALKIYPDSSDYKPSDITLTKENINILISRIYIELDQPDKAIERLSDSKISLDSSDDIIFNCLRQYKESGIIDKSLFKSINYEVNADDKDELNHHEHNHLINNGNDAKNNLLSKSNYLILKAGLLLLLCILGCCYL